MAIRKLLSVNRSITEEERYEALAELDALETALREYAGHQSWRCEYPNRYPWSDEDCKCGLIATLQKLGIETTEWREAALENDPERKR